jgi:hypothetical protein
MEAISQELDLLALRLVQLRPFLMALPEELVGVAQEAGLDWVLDDRELNSFTRDVESIITMNNL